MKLRILLVIVVCLPFFIRGQVTLTTQLPSNGILLKDQLWNMVITNNSDQIAEFKLQVDVRDVSLGQSVLNASSGKLIIGKGMKLITINDLQPVMYNYMATEFSGGYLPCGSYTISYHLVMETTKGDVPVADDLTRINVIPLSPPLLTTPLDKSTIENVHPQFSWMPPTPMQMFSPLTYDIALVAIEEGQSSKEAMEFNKPFYSSTNLQQPNEKLATSFEQLEPGKRYAWQVVARSGYSCAAVSELWEFRIKSPSVENSIDKQIPFTKMKNGNPDMGIAPNGMLKISYINETTEKEIVVQIIDPTSDNKTIPQFKIAVHAGENLIQYDLNKLMHLQKGGVYEARIMNNRGERWAIQFEYRQYQEQTPDKAN